MIHRMYFSYVFFYLVNVYFVVLLILQIVVDLLHSKEALTELDLQYHYISNAM